MELVLVLRWIVWVNCLIILLTIGGKGTLVQMPFYKTRTGGKKLGYLKTHSHVRSTMDCASMCKEDWKIGDICQAFWHHTDDNTCDVYVYGATARKPGVDIFHFYLKSMFHVISLNDRLYSVYFGPGVMTFSDARKHCNDRGGYLLEFDTSDEYNAVRMIGLGGYFHYAFVGANDIRHSNVWVTDRKGLPISTGKWRWQPGQPSKKAGENCAALESSTNRIYDRQCSSRSEFFCEKDIP